MQTSTKPSQKNRNFQTNVAGSRANLKERNTCRSAGSYLYPGLFQQLFGLRHDGVSQDVADNIEWPAKVASPHQFLADNDHVPTSSADDMHQLIRVARQVEIRLL